jgi:nitrite reductase/ring-hydroxylating ferredoxin subunit
MTDTDTDTTARPSLRFPKAELPPGGRKVIKLGRREVVAFNVEGDLYAVFNRCPHHRAPLDRGVIGGTTLPCGVGEMKFGAKGKILRCAWHHYEFDLTTGRSVADPERLRVRTYDIREEGDEIVVTA